MRLGIDIHVLRQVQSGLYYYVWNLVNSLVAGDHAHQITLFLYGPRCLNTPERLRKLRNAFQTAGIEYFWDGAPLRLLSNSRAAELLGSPRFLRTLNQNFVLPIWHRIETSDKLPIKWRADGRSVSRKVDVFHHPYGLILPVNDRANVMTVPDLIPRRFPEFCQAGTIALAEEAFACLDRMDVVLTFSQHTKAEVVESLGVSEDKIRVIPLAAHGQVPSAGEGVPEGHPRETGPRHSAICPLPWQSGSSQERLAARRGLWPPPARGTVPRASVGARGAARMDDRNRL